MKPQDITFTMAPQGGRCYVQMTFSCRTPGELMSAKEAITESLDTIGTAWNREEKKYSDVTKANAQRLLDSAFNVLESDGGIRQQGYVKGLISMARTAGIITQGDFESLSVHLAGLTTRIYGKNKQD